MPVEMWTASSSPPARASPMPLANHDITSLVPRPRATSQGTWSLASRERTVEGLGRDMSTVRRAQQEMQAKLEDTAAEEQRRIGDLEDETSQLSDSCEHLDETHGEIMDTLDKLHENVSQSSLRSRTRCTIWSSRDSRPRWRLCSSAFRTWPIHFRAYLRDSPYPAGPAA